MKTRTIVGQMIAGTLLVQALVFGTFLTLSVREQFRDTRTRDSLRLEKQTAIIVGLLAEPLEKNDADLLDHVVHAIPIAASLRGVRVTDPQGNMLRNTSPQLPMQLTDAERTLMPDLAKSGRYHRLVTEDGDDEGAQPVIADGMIRGIVWVTQDKILAASTPNRVLQSLLIYFPFALIGNLLLVWALSGTLSRPLATLRRATIHVQQDPNDLSAFPLPVVAHNEAGLLTSSFNAMVAEIARQRRGMNETLNLLDSMLSGAPIGFAFYDKEYRYVRINERLADLHGIPMASHVGKRLRDLLPPDAGMEVPEQIEALIERVFRTEQPVAEQEITGVLPGNPDARTWQVSYFPVLSAGEVRWVGVIVREITERKRAEEALRRSEKMAAAGRMAASIAHEINNPLESITNLMYLLREDPTLSPQGREYANMAQEELLRVGEITQQTLRFYRQSSLPADVQMPEVLRSVLVLHAARLRSAGINVNERLDPNTIFFGYAGELRQMFANMVGNAVDAMPAGGTLYIRARNMRRAGRLGLRVTVADTGVGMNVAVLRRIFEPFFTTKETNGTGLGLWITEEILQKHHGSVLVRSRQAHYRGDTSGTVFSIFFPYDGVPRGPRIVPSAAPALVANLG